MYVRSIPEQAGIMSDRQYVDLWQLYDPASVRPNGTAGETWEKMRVNEHAPSVQ
jgi:hypothetical protein